MNKELTSQLQKQEQAHKAELQKVRKQVIAESEKRGEAKETEAINELANADAKKMKKLNSELKDKESMLDQAVDRSSELTNKLNDVQAAAYLKDEKIHKMNGEGAKLKAALS
jgi:hypothetical protein